MLVIITHEVKNTKQWAKVWGQIPNGRRDMLFQAGVNTVHTFHDPLEPTKTGLLLDVTDEDRFMALINSDEVATTMKEDGVLHHTIQILVEFAS